MKKKPVAKIFGLTTSQNGLVLEVTIKHDPRWVEFFSRWKLTRSILSRLNMRPCGDVRDNITAPRFTGYSIGGSYRPSQHDNSD